MEIGIAVDHGGYILKQAVMEYLRKEGHHITDYGAYALNERDDYPDFVIPLAGAVSIGEVERGIAICGSGVGANIAANKVIGVRAALITDPFSATQGVEDDDMNLICIGGRVIGPSLALQLVSLFLHARFSGADRHIRRLKKIADVERRTKS